LVLAAYCGCHGELELKGFLGRETTELTAPCVCLCVGTNVNNKIMTITQSLLLLSLVSQAAQNREKPASMAIGHHKGIVRQDTQN